MKVEPAPAAAKEAPAEAEKAAAEPEAAEEKPATRKAPARGKKGAAARGRGRGRGRGRAGRGKKVRHALPAELRDAQRLVWSTWHVMLHASCLRVSC